MLNTEVSKFFYSRLLIFRSFFLKRNKIKVYCLRSCGKVGLIRSINVCEVNATMTPHWIKVRWFLNISTASGWLSGDVILGWAAPVCAVPCVSVWVYLYFVVHSVRTKQSRKASGLIVRKWSKDNILFTWWSEAVLAGTPALPSTLSPPHTLSSPCFFLFPFNSEIHAKNLCGNFPSRLTGSLICSLKSLKRK